MSEVAVVDEAVEAAHRAVHALHATGCIRGRGAQDCPLLPDLRAAVVSASKVVEERYLLLGRAHGLVEAADEVLTECRWQLEQAVRARTGAGKHYRTQFAERLHMVATILTDRARCLTDRPEPDPSDASTDVEAQPDVARLGLPG